MVALELVAVVIVFEPHIAARLGIAGFRVVIHRVGPQAHLGSLQLDVAAQVFQDAV